MKISHAISNPGEDYKKSEEYLIGTQLLHRFASGNGITDYEIVERIDGEDLFLEIN
jgi:hypothetical protein